MIYIVIFLFLLLAYFLYAFNRMVRLKNLVREAWSGIDVQLRRRRNLIPLLSQVTKSYRDFERDVMEELVRLRSEADGEKNVRKREEKERRFMEGVRKIIAIGENYPDLKASEVYLNLQRELSKIEDDIQFARRFYNGAVRDYNTFITIFPNNIVARLLGFREAEFFDISAEERETPGVNLKG